LTLEPEPLFLAKNADEYRSVAERRHEKPGLPDA
jgi:hypothetical protein